MEVRLSPPLPCVGHLVANIESGIEKLAGASGDLVVRFELDTSRSTARK